LPGANLFRHSRFACADSRESDTLDSFSLRLRECKEGSASGQVGIESSIYAPGGPAGRDIDQVGAGRLFVAQSFAWDDKALPDKQLTVVALSDLFADQVLQLKPEEFTGLEFEAADKKSIGVPWQHNSIAAAGEDVARYDSNLGAFFESTFPGVDDRVFFIAESYLHFHLSTISHFVPRVESCFMATADDHR